MATDAFNGTLVLRWPVLLPPASAGDTRVVIWFSTTKHEDREVVVWVAKPDINGSSSAIYADGTDASVCGPCKLVGRTLLVVASSVVARGGDASVVSVASLPPFADTIWPALICGSVVSEPQLAVEQPGFAVTEVIVKRQTRWFYAPVEIRCSLTGGATLAFEGRSAVLRGRLIGFDNGHIRVAIHDVRVGYDVVWWEQATLVAAEEASATAEEPECPDWPLPYTPVVCVVEEFNRDGTRSHELTSKSRPEPFF